VSASVAVSGLVLAGGRATRFGADKLSTSVRGRTLVEFSIVALSALCVEVIVVTGPSGEPPHVEGVVVPVRFVRDASAGGGPVVGLVAGLEMAGSPVVLVAGGDMPAMIGDVLALLVQRIEDGVDAAALMDGDAWRPLPVALRRAAALAVAKSLPQGSRLRDVLARLDVVTVPEPVWRPLDLEGRTLLDVDRPEDLDRLPSDLV
jgi:molybdopterin-guanine dinucleotide biosynthesis protein A